MLSRIHCFPFVTPGLFPVFAQALPAYEFINVDFSSDLSDNVMAEIETAHIRTEKRLEKLISMRDNVEELLDKILKVEVNE